MKTAIITGGARGIGLGIAKTLRAEGYRLALIGRSPYEKVRDTVEALGEAVYEAMDIADLDSHQATLDRILAACGPIDLLVNNAGIAPKVRADLMEMAPASFDEVMAVNLRGPLFFTQRVARHMLEEKARRGGDYTPRIITMTSMSAYTASVNRGEYCISKAGLSMASTLFAARLSGEGIAVFEVRPGIVATDMTRGVTGKYDELIAQGITPVRRWGQPEDMGNVVAALASGKFDFCAGQIMDADGGFHIQRL